MARICMLAALALSLSMADSTFGQGQPVPLPGTPLLPVLPTTPPPPSLQPGAATRAPGIPYQQLSPFTTIPAPAGRVVPTQSSEHYAVPAKIEFNDGTTLSGEIQPDRPLECVALFGTTLIPFNQIKGIEWRSGSEQSDEQERKATLVLINNDALTVTVAMPTIQLKTSWGHAMIELAQARSMLMTSEKVKWADTPDGRRVLVPIDVPRATM